MQNVPHEHQFRAASQCLRTVPVQRRVLRPYLLRGVLCFCAPPAFAGTLHTRRPTPDTARQFRTSSRACCVSELEQPGLQPSVPAAYGTSLTAPLETYEEQYHRKHKHHSGQKHSADVRLECQKHHSQPHRHNTRKHKGVLHMFSITLSQQNICAPKCTVLYFV